MAVGDFSENAPHIFQTIAIAPEVFEMFVDSGDVEKMKMDLEKENPKERGIPEKPKKTLSLTMSSLIIILCMVVIGSLLFRQPNPTRRLFCCNYWRRSRRIVGWVQTAKSKERSQNLCF